MIVPSIRCNWPPDKVLLTEGCLFQEFIDQKFDLRESSRGKLARKHVKVFVTKRIGHVRSEEICQPRVNK